MSETEATDSTPAAEADGRPARVMERLISAADVSKAYGKPIHHGQALLLPAAEVLAIAGFGMGSGSGVGPDGRSRGHGGGGGGGGQALARSVAVIVSTPKGVTVKPIFDFTKIALAALTAAGFVWASWKGMSRPKRFLSR
ncbi:MAG TPA: hypothetical protein VMR54_05185 [Thermoanaerobaculia bacterium]|nr:hypothetical protein [Thermoanaerobaculia bacterium]